jgi:ankyrin repeat protein
MKKREITREGDLTYVKMPDLRKDPITLQFITAALNGVVDQDINNNKVSISSLSTLFKKYSLNSEAKEYILPYIITMAKQLKREIPNLENVVKCLAENGAEGKRLLVANEISFKVIKTLIEFKGVDVNYIERNYSALHASVVSKDDLNFEERVVFLLNKGINPNLVYDKFGTALHMAIANESFNDKMSQFTARTLIKYLQDPKYKYDWNIRDEEGKTILILAAKVRSRELVEDIISVKQRGVNIDINAADNEGRSALHFAAALGNNASVIALLNAGANINLQDKYGRTPLHYAVMREELVKKILEEIFIDPERDENALRNHLLDINHEPVYIGNDPNKTIRAVKDEVDKVMPFILQQFESMSFPSQELKDFDINFMRIQSNLTGKPLIKACMEGHVEVAKTLMSKDAKLDMKNSQGNTPFMIAERDFEDKTPRTTFTDREISKKIKTYFEEYIKLNKELQKIEGISISNSNSEQKVWSSSIQLTNTSFSNTNKKEQEVSYLK